MQKGSALKVVVLVVAIVVIVLALWMSKSDKIVSGPTSSPTPSSSASKSGPMTAEQLFKVEPNAGASEEQQVAHYNKISASAVAASSVDVTACMPKPSVVKVNVGGTVTLKNNDSMSHRVYNGTVGNVDVPAKGEHKLEIDKQGAFGYTCDEKLVGIFFVTQ